MWYKFVFLIAFMLLLTKLASEAMARYPSIGGTPLILLGVFFLVIGAMGLVHVGSHHFPILPVDDPKRFAIFIVRPALLLLVMGTTAVIMGIAYFFVDWPALLFGR